MKAKHLYSRIALALVVSAAEMVAQTSVSFAPADKNDTPNQAVVDRLTNQGAIPIPKVDNKWIIPPAPIAFNWAAERDDSTTLAQWEHSWEVTHVKFDHAPGHGNNGMNIRWSYRTDLSHAGDGAGAGEYDVAKGNNEPALYMVQTAAVVKVRIQCKRGNAAGLARRAMIRAVANTGDAFLDLDEREVAFDAGGISVGDDGSEYVEFLATGVIPNQVGEYTARYKFYLKEPQAADGSAVDPQREVMFDELSRIDLYSVYRFPLQPWNYQVKGDPPDTLARSQPWVTALGFMCYACGCAGQSSLNTLVGNTAKHLHWGHAGTAGHGMKYNRVDGAPGFTTGQSGIYNHGLTQYMAKRKSGFDFDVVNCTDQACAVHALMQLAYTGKTTGLYLKGDGANRDWFGYMQPALFVGGVQSNHPFHQNPDYVNQAIVGNDDLITQTTPAGLIKRSAFEFHAAVRLESGLMADACFNPVLPSSSLTLAGYLFYFRDTSTQAEQTINGKGVFAVGDEKTIDLTIR